MTSVKPYFIQALHSWIGDNGLTPLIVVDPALPGIRVPDGIVEDGKIVLNISFDATQNLNMDDDVVSFSARFSGRSQVIIIPMEAITAIYARENGKGMMFDVEQVAEEAEDEAESKVKKKVKDNKSHLKLVD